MKRFALLFILGFLLNGCDDGNLEVKSFNFGTASASLCGSETTSFFLYKTKEKEAFLLKLNESLLVNADSTNVVTIDGTSVQVFYRLYDNTVTGSDLCAAIIPASPIVKEEWKAIGGTMQIVSAPVFKEDATTGSKILLKYQHTITFPSITFDTPNGNVTYDDDTLSFGSVDTPVLAMAAFDCETCTTINKCPDTTRMFKYEGTQALTLDLPQDTYDSLFANEVTTTPKTAPLTGAMTYRIFNIGVNAAYFCGPPSTTVTTLETWNAVGGTISVETTSVGNSFVHKVTLVNAVFRNEANNPVEFTYGNAYNFGELVTVP